MDLGFKVSSADLGGVLDGLTRPKGKNRRLCSLTALKRSKHPTNGSQIHWCEQRPKSAGGQETQNWFQVPAIAYKTSFFVNVVGKSDKWLQLPKSAPTWFQNPTPLNQLQKSQCGPKVEVVRKAFTTQNSKRQKNTYTRL